jgi:diguanylate cyclase (GGDEF)-like protein
VSQLLFIIGCIFIVLFFYSLIKFKSRIATIFSLTSLAIAFYTIGYSFELTASSVEEIWFILQYELTGLVFLPAFLILVSYHYYFKKDPTLLEELIIFLIPFLSAFFILTNKHHHFYYKSLEIVKYKNHSISILEKGPWYYVFVTYTIIAFIIGVIVFLKKWFEEQLSIRTSSFWMLIGLCFPYIAYWVYFFELTHYPYDFTSIGFAMQAICFYMAVFKYDFLDLKAIAWKRVFDKINEGIIVINPQYQLIDYNQASNHTFPWINKKQVGRPINLHDEGELIIQSIAESFSIEVIRNDRPMHLGFTMTPLIEKRQLIGQILIFQDITEQTTKIKKLNYLATHDSLTNTYNKAHFLIEAEKEIDRSFRYHHAFSLLMLDIDDFKLINDQHGHLAGDAVLKTLPENFKSVFSSSDLIGRYGGEEFIFFLVETNQANAILKAETLRKKIKQTITTFGDLELKVTVSIGIYTNECTQETKLKLEAMIKKADEALYRAKESGKDQINY